MRTRLILAIIATTVFTQATVPTTDRSIVTSDNLTKCPKLAKARWQGPCISDWAIAVSTAVELQMCVQKSEFKDLTVSYQDLVCNCKSCFKGANGCMGGGDIKEALNFLKNTGAVGGDFKGWTSNQPAIDVSKKPPKTYKYCLNYFADECYNVQVEGKTQCTKDQVFDPKTHCPVNCNFAGSTDQKVVDVREKTWVTSVASTVSGYTSIYSNLSGKHVLIASMEIYEDLFMLKKDDVYIHSHGQSLGNHAVVILGFKIDSKTTLPYWEVLVPFGKEIAGGSFLKILAGVNHCNIENEAHQFEVTLDFPQA